MAGSGAPDEDLPARSTAGIGGRVRRLPGFLPLWHPGAPGHHAVRAPAPGGTADASALGERRRMPGLAPVDQRSADFVGERLPAWPTQSRMTERPRPAAATRKGSRSFRPVPKRRAQWHRPLPPPAPRPLGGARPAGGPRWFTVVRFPRLRPRPRPRMRPGCPRTGIERDHDHVLIPEQADLVTSASPPGRRGMENRSSIGNLYAAGKGSRVHSAQPSASSTLFWIQR
jgi:hypothetical protein